MFMLTHGHAILPEVPTPTFGKREFNSATAETFASISDGFVLGAERRRWQQLARSDAILEVLREVRRPIDRNELCRELEVRGRKDHLEAVSAALAYLKRSRRAVNPEGKWRLIESGEGDGAGKPE